MKKINLNLAGQFKHNNIGVHKFKSLLGRVLARPSDQMLLVLGAPGIGKTQIVYEFIEEQFGRVIDQGEFKREGGINLVVLRTEDMDRSSFSLPGYDRPDTQNGRRAIQCPFGYIPAYKPVGDMPNPNDPDYEKKCQESVDWNADRNLGRGIIFLDEINRCNPDAEDVIKNIIERKFCDGWHIGSGWGIVAAGNRLEDDPDRVHEIGTAFFNRFGLQYNFVPKYEEWREWAANKNYMNTLVLDWIKDNPEHFYFNTTCDTEENGGAEDKKFTTPRTWELACKNLSIAANPTVASNPFNLTPLNKYDVTIFSESQIREELSPLDPKTVTEFIKFLNMIKVVDVQRIKDEIWTKGKHAMKIQNNDGSSATTAVECAIIKMCVDAKTMGVPQNVEEARATIKQWLPNINEVKSLFEYLTNYNASMAQMTLQYFLDSFKIFKEVFQTYMRMMDCVKEHKTAKESERRDKSKLMADRIKERLVAIDMYDYCDKFDESIGTILGEKWPKLVSKINWNE